MSFPSPVPSVHGESFCITASNVFPDAWPFPTRHRHLRFTQPEKKNSKSLCSHSRSRVFCSSENATKEPWSPAQALRRLLKSPGLHQGPACFDALSAKLIERAGFDLCFTSGFSISAARLGLPDAGLISMGEMVDQGLQITQAVSIPVIGDGDNGYGNAMNVKRTVKEYIRAGFAGIILEDQVSPKACGHTRGRQVVSREEAVMRIKAAIDAREESGRDIVIVARTDSKQADSFEEAIWRANAFAQAGADVLFIDALSSAEEIKYFCQISTSVPKMANMLEGGGKTPILAPIELEEMGYKLVAYPLSLIGVSIQAMMDSLTALKGGRIPSPGSMPSFDELKDILGFNEYYYQENRYSIPSTGIQVITPEVYNEETRSFSTKLRIKITGPDGVDKLDIKIPAGFLDGVTNIVPALGGVDIRQLIDDAGGKGGKVLLDFTDAIGDKIRVSLE